MTAATDPRPGRVCPVHYRYAPASFARTPEVHADVVYVVGGLYGNAHALDQVERLAAAEPGGARIVFNGDFHWFDVEPRAFAAVDARARAHVACRGNVETEIASDADDAGCGCAYPESVSDAEVGRSNDILARLRDTAGTLPGVREALGALPMTCVAQVGTLRVAIAHGDAESLAGWNFAHDRLDGPGGAERLARWLHEAQADVFATSHTCLPCCRIVPGGVAINNGAAGMPNFEGTSFGVVTRIGVRPAPDGLALYGAVRQGVHVDAVRLDYDAAAFARDFLAAWPPGSAAHQSYAARIARGPAYPLARARTRAPAAAPDRSPVTAGTP